LHQRPDQGLEIAAFAASYCVFRFYRSGNYVFAMGVFSAAAIPMVGQREKRKY